MKHRPKQPEIPGLGITRADARFYRLIDWRGAADCWPWAGSRDGSGRYGKFQDANGRMVRAHRYSYEDANGPIPAGLIVRHTCDNPNCVNPAHLIAGTQADNMADARERGRVPQIEAAIQRITAISKALGARSACAAGHAYDDENTSWREHDGRRWRVCRACRRDFGKRHRARLRADGGEP